MESQTACYHNTMIKEILLIILSFGIVVSGAVGVIVPFLPGMPIAWLGMLVFGYATGFAAITWKVLLIFLGLTVLTMIFDVLAPLVGAKKYHASRYGIIGSFLGLIFGIMLFGPLGIIVGPFVGAFLGELLKGRAEEEALQSAKGTVIGFLAGSAIKFSLIAVMLGFMIFALITA